MQLPSKQFHFPKHSGLAKNTLSCDKHDHFRKFSSDFDQHFLSQFFIKIENQGQFWNPHDEQISKLSLIFNFDKEITEKKTDENFRKWSCLSHDSVTIRKLNKDIIEDDKEHPVDSYWWLNPRSPCNVQSRYNERVLWHWQYSAIYWSTITIGR